VIVKRNNIHFDINLYRMIMQNRSDQGFIV
jgi:hypothetical protein